MKRLASFILAFIFLGSNLGLAMGTHFCGGHAMEAEVMLGHDDLSCGMMPEVIPTPDHRHTSINTIPCCANEFQSLQIEDDFQKVVTKLIVEQVVTLTPLFSIADFSKNIANTLHPSDYTPPIRTDEVTTLFQVFRI